MAKGDPGKIELEVQKAFGVKPKDGEDFEDYLKRISAAIDKDDTDKWETLSDEAQEHMNKVSKALKKGTELPPFPGDDEADEGDDDNKAPAKAS